MIPNELPRSLQDNPWLEQWIRLPRHGVVEVGTGKVEIGQGILTALAQLAADELDVDLARLDLVSGDTAGSPDEGYTAGSMSIEMGGRSLQIAAATMRDTLLRLAAERLGRDAARLSVEDGRILADGVATGLDYWALADAVPQRLRITGEAPLKRADARRFVGRSVPRPELTTRILGGDYIHDLVLPGMRHARVLHREPVVAPETIVAQSRGRLELLRVGRFTAFVGTAEAAVAAAAERAYGPIPDDLPVTDRPSWFETRPAIVSETLAGTLERRSDATQRHAARFSRPFILHASIGPSCALARYQDGELTVWSHSQGVFFLRDAIAKVLGLARDKVRVIHKPGAGCYGHNPADDVAFDAALIAYHRPGEAIRVQWTRPDELGAAPVGAAMSIGLEAGLDATGAITDWRTELASPTHAGRPGTAGLPNLLGAVEAGLAEPLPGTDDIPDGAGAGARRNAVLLYDVPGQAIRYRLLHDLPVRPSSLRGLGAFANVFAIESFMDELAALAGVDPIAFRLRHTSDPRARAVIETAATMAAWEPGAETGTGSGMGLGFARYKNRAAYCAVVAAVTVEEEVRVDRVWCAVDAGLVVNPDGVVNQIEGGIVQSISWALFEGVRFDGERVASASWDTYPILRFSGVPEIETRLVTPPEGAGPLGAGEASHGPTAGAVGNAVARALGLRLRDLPLTRDRIVAAMMSA